MNRIFNYEGPLFTGLSRVADLFWLNILFLVCSIPIVTIGASTTALYYVTMKMVKNEDCYITKSFFKSFKMNFKQSTIIWLLVMLSYGVLFIDYRIMSGGYINVPGGNSNFNTILSAVLIGITIFLTFTVIYVFPVLAKFYNSTKNTIRNAFLMSIRHFPFTLLLVLIAIAPFVLMYFFSQLIIIFFCLAFSLIAFVSSYIFVKVFDNYLPKDETDPDAFTLDEEVEGEIKEEIVENVVESIGDGE